MYTKLLFLVAAVCSPFFVETALYACSEQIFENFGRSSEPRLKLNGVSRVVSAMPGAGKSTLMSQMAANGIRVSDSDSQRFSFLTNKDGQYVDLGGNIVSKKEDRVANPNFVEDYTAHIREALATNDMVFVSAHEAVRDALAASGIEFDLVRHHEDAKGEVVDRIRNRKSNQPNEIIADVVNSQWENWMKSIDKPGPQQIIVLESGEFLSDKFGFDPSTNSLNPQPSIKEE